ncbi:TetR/AcrR family transcriptional regulator [Mycobacterium sp. 29Ha]|uniref:TetR/AcrR family transcriptional regulator n=1 Tax=Mycobacterium sp. 29Ha TaxID=2939268 RepID=UPI002939088E|nr:TetR/AcrR family transcriptional regulator [Mycobacterium sp. 29Ha]MDV3133419.1 TetR/AcrR family transcriptional regulator [Mycobacterium sp. 29Ha]
MSDLDHGLPVDADDDVDPRWVRSRTRLLDAAANLLRSGGIEAVTVEAVTRASKVARTTLYRHFGSSSELLAATFERLLPPAAPPPSADSVRDQLIDLLSQQAHLLDEAPLHLTTLAWVALVPNSAGHRSNSSLRARVGEQYRQAFDAVLQSPQARVELGELDAALVLCQLLGPLVFARMTGLRSIDHRDCVRLVDDFLAAHRSDSINVSPLKADSRTHASTAGEVYERTSPS